MKTRYERFVDKAERSLAKVAKMKPKKRKASMKKSKKLTDKCLTAEAYSIYNITHGWLGIISNDRIGMEKECVSYSKEYPSEKMCVVKGKFITCESAIKSARKSEG